MGEKEEEMAVMMANKAVRGARTGSRSVVAVRGRSSESVRGRTVARVSRKNDVHVPEIVPNETRRQAFMSFLAGASALGVSSKAQIFARIVGALGGRAAEKVVFGDDEVTSGASSDLQQVTNMAKQMVT